MPERTGRVSGECLDPEVLSAYIDGQLDVSARAEVEAHLASCADCHDVMSEVLHIQEALPAARSESSSTPQAWDSGSDAARDVVPAPVPRPDGDHVVRGAFGRRKAVWGAAGVVLAAAAALVLVVRLQPTWWTGGVDPKLADLVEAVGEERTVEARLTGGFKYGPLRSPVRSGGRVGPTDNWRLLAAAGRIREEAEKDPTPGNAHAAGIGSVLVGDLDAGIRLLESATRADATNASMANDLAVAYFARFKLNGTADDLPRALESAERALTLTPDLLEALFNRALLLEAMGIKRTAVEAWEAYLRDDSTSSWAEEAKQHLGALQPALGRIRSGTESVIRRLASWADARIARNGQPSEDAPPLAFLVRDLDAVAETSKDVMWRDEANALRALAAPGRESELDALARGYRCLVRVIDAHRRADMASVLRLAAECRDGFARAHAGLEAWAILHTSIGAAFQGDLAASAAAARELVEHPQFGVYRVAVGRAHYQLGGIAYVETRFRDALASIRQAIDRLAGIEEPEALASAYDISGLTFLRIGDRRAAWRSFAAALQSAPESADSLGGYATRNSVGLTSLRLGYPHVARVLFGLGLEDARTINGASRIAESHYEMARAGGALDDDAAMSAHLAESRRALADVPDSGIKRRIEAELLALESELALRRDDMSAVDKAASARTMLESLGLRMQSARLFRYEAAGHLRGGRAQNRERAAEALEQGMSILESQESALQQRRLQVGFRDAVWDVYSDAIRFAVESGDMDRAIALFERARSRRFQGDPSSLAAAAPRPEVDPDTAVIAFHCVDAAVYRWVLTGREASFRALPIDRSELDRLVWQTRLDLIRDGGDASRAAQTLGALLFQELPQAALSARGWVLVPDGPLYRAPFAALRFGSANDLVSEHHDVAIAPTIAGYRPARWQRSPPAAPSVSVLAAPENEEAGLPNLAGARNEGRRIGSLYERSTIFDGRGATSDALMTALARPGIVHFAGHAVADASMPWLGYLVVSPSPSNAAGLVYAGDLQRARAEATVVVLAACSTAEGFEFRGEGLVSLAKGFIDAGVPWVVGTLWDIPDDAASAFFLKLHHYLAAGMAPAAAVRRTQEDARAAHASPAVWASVAVLVG